MIWMMAPIGRGGKGRAFPPVSISQWGQRADQRCFLSPILTPVLPPPCGPGTWRTAPSATRRTRSWAHRMASPRQSHSGPRAPARGGAGPSTHTPGEGTRPLRAVYAQTHTNTHRLTLNGHIKPNSVFFSLPHTHLLAHTADLTHTLWWWCTHTRWRLCTFQTGRIFSSGVGGGGGYGTWQLFWIVVYW